MNRKEPFFTYWLSVSVRSPKLGYGEPVQGRIPALCFKGEKQLISFKHILGTNMVSILLRGKNTDYEFAAAIVHILNTGTVQQLTIDEFHKLLDLRRFSLMEKTEEGWKVFNGRYIRKAGPLGVYLGNCTVMAPEVPTTYRELEKQGNFNTFLTPVMVSRSPVYDED